MFLISAVFTVNFCIDFVLVHVILNYANTILMLYGQTCINFFGIRYFVLFYINLSYENVFIYSSSWFNYFIYK